MLSKRAGINDISLNINVDETPIVEAVKSHLAVAVVTRPFRELNREEANQLQEDLIKELFKPLEINTTEILPLPAFHGQSFLCAGAFYMWCSDGHALTWLRETVRVIRSPVRGTTLEVVRQKDVPRDEPRDIRATIFIPGCKRSLRLLQRVLIAQTAQNTKYDVPNWKLYSYSYRTAGKPGTLLELGIPERDMEQILANHGRIAYGLGEISICLTGQTTNKYPNDVKMEYT